MQPHQARQLQRAGAVVTAHLRGNTEDRSLLMDEFDTVSAAADGFFLLAQASVTLAATVTGRDPAVMATELFGDGPAGDGEHERMLRRATRLLHAQLAEDFDTRDQLAAGFDHAGGAADAAFALAVAVLGAAARRVGKDAGELAETLTLRAAAAGEQGQD